MQSVCLMVCGCQEGKRLHLLIPCGIDGALRSSGIASGLGLELGVSGVAQTLQMIARTWIMVSIHRRSFESNISVLVIPVGRNVQLHGDMGKIIRCHQGRAPL